MIGRDAGVDHTPFGRARRDGRAIVGGAFAPAIDAESLFQIMGVSMSERATASGRTFQER